MAVKRAAAVCAGFAVDMHGGAPRLTIYKRRRICSQDDYEETCALGEGAFGLFVKARHHATGETVTVKKALLCSHDAE